METLLLYFGKMILCSGVMFGYYFVFLKDKTFHHYNRFYLLSILFLSIFLPLIKIDYFTIEVNPDLFLLIKDLQTVSPQNFAQNDFNIYPFLFAIIGLVSVFFILKFLFGLIKIQRLKNQFPKTEFEGIKFYETPLEEAPFSYFRNLFWKNSIELKSDLGRQILKHEMVHIEQKHTWDKIILTVVNSPFWFNPIFYLIKKEIFLIHEYLADKKTVKQSDTKSFAQMLLASHFTGTSLPATSPFFNSNLKKRIIMLKKSHTKFSYLRKISALPVIFLLAFAYLVNAKNREIKQTNQVIATAVSQIKNDNLKIKKDTIRNEAKTSLRRQHENKSNSLKLISYKKFRVDNQKIKKISESLALKSNELSKLKADSNEFTSKQKEISDLDKKLNDAVNSDSYKSQIGNAKIEGEKARAYVNSPEFKKQVAEAKLAGKKAKDYVNSPEFSKILADAKLAGEKAKEYVNSPEFKKVVADAQRQALIAVEDFKVDAKKNSLLGNPNVKYYLNGKLIDASIMKTVSANEIKVINVEKKPGEQDGGSVYIITKNSPLEVTPTQFDKITIDGKQSTQADLDQLNKDSIKTENIKKNTQNGKSFN